MITQLPIRFKLKLTEGVISVDYYQIGQQIRKYRKACGMSQEQLAERINISVTHMSHIETGNTKLSLPVFLDIAQTLEVRTDDLLCAAKPERRELGDELTQLLDECTAQQLRIVTEVARALKTSLEKYGK